MEQVQKTNSEGTTYKL